MQRLNMRLQKIILGALLFLSPYVAMAAALSPKTHTLPRLQCTAQATQKELTETKAIFDAASLALSAAGIDCTTGVCSKDSLELFSKDGEKVGEIPLDKSLAAKKEMKPEPVTGFEKKENTKASNEASKASPQILFTKENSASASQAYSLSRTEEGVHEVVKYDLNSGTQESVSLETTEAKFLSDGRRIQTLSSQNRQQGTADVQASQNPSPISQILNLEDLFKKDSETSRASNRSSSYASEPTSSYSQSKTHARSGQGLSDSPYPKRRCAELSAAELRLYETLQIPCIPGEERSSPESRFGAFFGNSMKANPHPQGSLPSWDSVARAWATPIYTTFLKPLFRGAFDFFSESMNTAFSSDSSGDFHTASFESRTAGPERSNDRLVHGGPEGARSLGVSSSNLGGFRSDSIHDSHLNEKASEIFQNSSALNSRDSSSQALMSSIDHTEKLAKHLTDTLVSRLDLKSTAFSSLKPLKLRHNSLSTMSDATDFDLEALSREEASQGTGARSPEPKKQSQPRDQSSNFEESLLAVLPERRKSKSTERAPLDTLHA